MNFRERDSAQGAARTVRVEWCNFHPLGGFFAPGMRTL